MLNLGIEYSKPPIRMNCAKRYRLHPSEGRLWPLLIDLWIAAALVLFLVIRVLGSNTARHLIHIVSSH